jgi:hypothetical protein
VAPSTYTTIVAPIAEAQIDAALLWWMSPSTKKGFYIRLPAHLYQHC